MSQASSQEVVLHQVDRTQRYLTINAYRLLVFVCIRHKQKGTDLGSYLKGKKPILAHLPSFACSIIAHISLHPAITSSHRMVYMHLKMHCHPLLSHPLTIVTVLSEVAVLNCWVCASSHLSPAPI